MPLGSNQEVARDIVVAYITAMNKSMPPPSNDPRESGRYIARLYRTILKEIQSQVADPIPPMSEEKPTT